MAIARHILRQTPATNGMSDVSDCVHRLLMEDALFDYFALDHDFKAADLIRATYGPRYAEWRRGHYQWSSHGASIMVQETNSLLITDNWWLCSSLVRQRIKNNLRRFAGFVNDVLAACTTPFDHHPLILHKKRR